MPSETILHDELASDSATQETVTSLSTQTPDSVTTNTILARIRRDSRRDVDAYLKETEVPHGGE